jgi:hypothetical protein
MKPRKSVIIPMSLKDSSTLSPADLKMPSVTCLKINGSPVMTHLASAIANAIIKKKNQI